MKYSELFRIKCVICAERSYEWAIRPPLWGSDRCWNHLQSYRREWKDLLLSFLHSHKSLRGPQDDFQIFKETYMKTERPHNLLKKYGYDKYLLEHLEVSSFSDLEDALQRRFRDQPDFVLYKNEKKGKHRDSSVQSIISILREDCLRQLLKHPQFVSLQEVDLSGEDLSNCNLDFIVFDGAKLSNVNLAKSVLSNSIFASADLSNARLDEADISLCSFEEANLTGTSLLNAHGDKVRFGKAKLMECNARSSNLASADFRQTELNEVDLTGARLQHSDLSNSRLCRCSLEGAQMLGANFTNAKLINTQFHDINCPNGIFINSDLSNTDLRNSNFSSSNFTSCNLQNAVLCDSDLEGADVTHANLNFADLRNANLNKVDLYKADLKATRVYFENIQSSSILTNQLRDGSLVIERANRVRVFISYSHNDLVFARRLEDALRARSIDVWIDSQEILPGDSLIEKIREGIDTSQYVCALISSTSINSRWVKNELDIAMNQQIQSGRVKVIPLVLEENLRLPSFLVGKLYVDFSKIEYFENGLSQIIRRVDARSTDPVRRAVAIGARRDG